jgi:hypothetical protein
MKNKDKLVLLADKLDKKGLAAEAAFIDRLIVKRSFDEESRADVEGITAMIRKDISELIMASQGVDSSLQEIFLDKLNRINDAVSHLVEFNDLSLEDEEVASMDVEDHSSAPAVVDDASNWWDSLS